jgi:2'-5' RNA ligase
MFFSIATLVYFTRNDETINSWDRVVKISQRDCFDLSPIPHLSWHVAADYDLALVEEALLDITSHAKPFIMHASGLGIFSGIQPVFYFPVVKTKQLLDLHEEIWNRVHAATKSANLYYAPEQWIPHITMAYQKADSYNLCDVVGGLINERIEFELLVDHLAIIYRDQDELGQKGKFPFRVLDNQGKL